MALPIVATEALLDRASHRVYSHFPSGTPWVLQMELNQSLVELNCTGLLVLQVYRVLVAVFQPGLSR